MPQKDKELITILSTYLEVRLLAKVKIAQQGSQLNLQRDGEHRRRIGINYKEHWKANGRTNKKSKRELALELNSNIS